MKIMMFFIFFAILGCIKSEGSSNNLKYYGQNLHFICPKKLKVGKFKPKEFELLDNAIVLIDNQYLKKYNKIMKT